MASLRTALAAPAQKTNDMISKQIKSLKADKYITLTYDAGSNASKIFVRADNTYAHIIDVPADEAVLVSCVPRRDIAAVVVTQPTERNGARTSSASRSENRRNIKLPSMFGSLCQVQDSVSVAARSGTEAYRCAIKTIQ